MKPVVYQLFPRLFGNNCQPQAIGGTLQENGCGKFKDITTKALKELSGLGATHVWYTGVLSHATCTDTPTAGSPTSWPL